MHLYILYFEGKRKDSAVKNAEIGLGLNRFFAGFIFGLIREIPRKGILKLLHTIWSFSYKEKKLPKDKSQKYKVC